MFLACPSRSLELPSLIREETSELVAIAVLPSSPSVRILSLDPASRDEGQATKGLNILSPRPRAETVSKVRVRAWISPLRSAKVAKIKTTFSAVFGISSFSEFTL